MEIATEYRQRAQRKKLRVTFQDGRVICYKNVTDTFMEVLRSIPQDKLSEINVVFNHKPLVTQEPFREDLVRIVDGWYVEAVSNTETKYRHLLVINEQLNLGIKIEHGSDFETTETEKPSRNRKKKEYLKVIFPDGHEISGFKTTDTFAESIKRIGVKDVEKRELMLGTRSLITKRQQYNGQVEVEPGYWLSIPVQTKDKAKILKVLSSLLKQNLTITIV